MTLGVRARSGSKPPNEPGERRYLFALNIVEPLKTSFGEDPTEDSQFL
jgi:hypothetical protein